MLTDEGAIDPRYLHVMTYLVSAPERYAETCETLRREALLPGEGGMSHEEFGQSYPLFHQAIGKLIAGEQAAGAIHDDDGLAAAFAKAAHEVAAKAVERPRGQGLQ